MPEEGGGTVDGGGGPADSDDIMDLLPLQLVRSQLIPPAPNRRESAIDWLPEFGGLAWIAYGASSLLVISHFPSPLSGHEDRPDRFFQQVIEPPTMDEHTDLTAVSWCTAQPSDGELAAASGNNVFVYSPFPVSKSGSFSWRQTVRIVETFTIEAIKWTGSGDGLIAAGIEVVLWKRKSNSWEISWKVRMEVPQTLVSTTWFAEGFVATAAQALLEDDKPVAEDLYSSLSEEPKDVIIYHDDGKSGIAKVQLCHPQPVMAIQWRPFTAMQLQKNASPACRDILLTCCLDGTARLWSEIDNGRTRKFKDMHDQKPMRRLFHVVAVIEVNQSVKGTLGRNIFVKWALESGGIICKGEDDGYSLLSSHNKLEQIGKCEWLIGIGPNFSITFWAINCLDDVSPLRFPRVTMWKKEDLMDFKDSNCLHFDSSNTKVHTILIKVVTSRNWLFGPPVSCSLLQLLPDNSISWVQLYTPSDEAEVRPVSRVSKERSLSCATGSFLSEHGHTGCIIQVAVHPYACDIELAVSLDSNGLLLFWSLSTLSQSVLCVHVHIHPIWKVLGHIALSVLSPDHKFSCLAWVPSVLDECRFLLVGHEDGVDCFMIEVSSKGESILSHKILTVSFNGQNNRVGPPDQLFVTPIIADFGQSSCHSSFLMLCRWKENFKPLLWRVDLHMSGSNGELPPNEEGIAISEKGRCMSSTGKFYFATFYRQSFDLPAPHCCDEVTTATVVSPNNCVMPIQHASFSEFYTSNLGYSLATGYSDGTVKLWRFCHVRSNHHAYTEYVPWELVGTFTAHEGPVSAVSLSSFCSKIATTSICRPNNTTILHIWEAVKMTGCGSVVLEDAITLKGSVVTLSWSAIGNGQMLLGICLPNELRVYSQKRSSVHSFVHLDKSKETHIWYCIAVANSSTVLRDFLWGPKLTAVIVHEDHISVYSQWLTRADRACNVDDSVVYVGRKQENLLCSTNIDNVENIFKTKENLKSESVKKIYGQDYASNTKSRLLSILDVSEKLDGSLALYHPEALIRYICSGNWKRAQASLKHFVECISNNETSTANLESNKCGKFLYNVPEIHLSLYFEDNNSVNSSSERLVWGQSTISEGPTFHQGNSFQLLDSNLEPNTFGRFSSNSNKSGIMNLIDTLEKSHGISSITELEKTQMLVILDLLNDISVTSAYKSLDEAGRRFWVAVRFQYLYSIRKFGRSVAENLVVDSRLAAWAFQSDCQDDLLSSVLSAEPSWIEMRNLGVGLWYMNTSQLRTRMEKLARLQYLKSKNPKDCALLYLALSRLQVLAGLFKISRDEKDKVLFGFLSRNFKDEKNKAAALKNAYVLMGRHQLELAIAFFLLGGDPSSAVTVCAKNLGDEQLALVICRLLEGHGGPLECQLISNVLLPNALEKGDYWLSCILDWTMGNYSQSVKRLLDSQMKLVSSSSVTLCNFAALSDPDIGHYCMTLATRNSFRCSVGENVAAALSKLSAFLAASASNRCGLPLEALECLSSSLSIEGKDLKKMSGVENHDIFHGLFNPFSSDACNWLLENVAHQLELHTKLNMASRYISSFLRNHPGCLSINLSKSREVISCDYVDHQYEELGQLKRDISIIISLFDRKFSLETVGLVNKIQLFAHNSGSFFHGYLLLHVNDFLEGEDKHHSFELIMDHPAFLRLLFKATEEISCFLARFVVSFNFINSMLKPVFGSHDQQHPSVFCLKNILYLIWIFRLLSKKFQKVFVSVDLSSSFSLALDILEIYVNFSYVCIQRNTEGLVMIIHPILNALANDESSFEVLSDGLRKKLLQNSHLMVHGESNGEVGCISDSNFQRKHLEDSDFPVPEDEKWQLLGVCLWLHMLNFTKHGLSKFTMMEGHDESIENNMTLFLAATAKSLINSLTCVSSSLVKLAASFLRQKALKDSPVTSIIWLNECARTNPSSLNHCLNSGPNTLQLPDNEMQKSLKMLWDISICPMDICAYFAKEKVNCFTFNHENQFASWKDVHKNISSENDNVDSSNNRDVESKATNAPYKETKTEHGARVLDDDGSLETSRASEPRRDITYFHNPKEVMKRSGELFEAICFNSINEHEVAVASNKKGLIFFDLKAEEYLRVRDDYIWSESDWPRDGWAGCESTPVPTYVSQGIGLGSGRGAHLGLGGATIGLGSLARPGRDLTGGGAFGIPGYAGMGASGLGWGEEEDFEVFRDPPATVENIHSRALSRHPLLPFLLVGSSNTHVYLWEFGKDKATATYGVLPAANVPPPYALASVSALQFDHYGHRFATAALDGTICTWQLEVGGRSNVHPTDSSLCFSNHASDVAYVATSGSILAAAGYSTNGVNVILWDTLAPPATCQASLFCHEGGARSISVFDNDIGTGSISPIIVTGGKSGDVGLHDLRYIATGKTRRNRHASEQDLKTMHDANLGTSKYGENSNGMIWYIPKAHLGSVTRITTIPNTSLFLTGSKDGDVKLWDAKRSQLVFHWQKLHDRHTFLQPNSRGFGGVVRAAVTDIQVFSHGFLTCGGDGSVKLIQLK
ncbi:hypothetical protein Cni_G00057 [Canna indica]|uniref:RAVE complex protein Rav1 C-terminal domain-containing protein n=1 Tax=Canna indica TaxID=4628 RepID=A0AAQ3JKT5_9LILI|nr:hypothetical protein Cni_G00057 [Canna indica]